MESMLEILTQKERENKDIVYKVLSIAATVFLCLLAFRFLGNFGLFVSLLIVYLELKVQEYFSVEYEYCIINADIDIDKVYSKKRRGKYLSLSAAEIELIAPFSSSEAKDAFSKKFRKCYACKSKNDENNYVILGHSQSKGDVAVIVDRNDKMIAQFRKYIPSKVIVYGNK